LLISHFKRLNHCHFKTLSWVVQQLLVICFPVVTDF
jgi:hypothetical protein